MAKLAICARQASLVMPLRGRIARAVSVTDAVRVRLFNQIDFPWLFYRDR